MAKFTFKKEKPQTGLASVGNPNPDTIIKLDRMQVGSIVAPWWSSEDNKWAVRLIQAVEGDQEFRWVTLKKRFDEEPEARQYLNDNFDRIVAIGLHKIEPLDD